MNTTTKLAAYGAALALVGGGAWGIEKAVGPFGSMAGVEAAGVEQSDEPGGLASSKSFRTRTVHRR
ncbi:hypothetical protein DL991_40070 [Amycolatopsis sp. WAC 01375]|uniref:hypothetical protein n=1 Tax=Amycolatopsis sp. WAC 01375 TaxID=2203194 RepID=UPI000F7ABCBC|nr:hypothetical protein [Amycolatopsis sp. WAC 01375]RSM69347.1 hypothetical protein DL991_40070 [Amycolatopsis sp. WAC 01375]